MSLRQPGPKAFCKEAYSTQSIPGFLMCRDHLYQKTERLVKRYVDPWALMQDQ